MDMRLKRCITSRAEGQTDLATKLLFLIASIPFLFQSWCQVCIFFAGMLATKKLSQAYITSLCIWLAVKVVDKVCITLLQVGIILHQL